MDRIKRNCNTNKQMSNLNKMIFTFFGVAVKMKKFRLPLSFLLNSDHAVYRISIQL